MSWDFAFFLTDILLGVGLAMDAFSVSVANGLNEPGMSVVKKNAIALVYGAFQFAMPALGWFCVNFFVDKFEKVAPYIPHIALVLLSFIGVKMILDSLRNSKKPEEEKTGQKLTVPVLLLQGVATSIDALSVGFTIQGQKFAMALVSCLIIGVVTYAISLAGLQIGKKVGTGKLERRASVIGGIILVCVGIEIFVKGILS